MRVDGNDMPCSGHSILIHLLRRFIDSFLLSRKCCLRDHHRSPRIPRPLITIEDYDYCTQGTAIRFFSVPYDGSSNQGSSFTKHPVSMPPASHPFPISPWLAFLIRGHQTPVLVWPPGAVGLASAWGGLRAEGSTWVQTLHLLGLKTPF